MDFLQKIQFICRTTWEKNTGPCGNSCSSSDIGKTKPSSIFDNIFWQYDNGTITDTKYNLNYVLTTVSNTPSYEQGESKFLIPLSNIPRFTLRLNNISWILTGTDKTPVSVVLKIAVNTYIRNDTNMPNASPISALPPYIGLQQSCQTVIKIPVIDPDDDSVACRWAESKDCDQSCTDLPHADLNQKACTIELYASTRNGYQPGQRYRVTLMVDDFPRYGIFMNNKAVTPQQKISSTPVQFTIHIVNGPTSCDTNMKFVSLTVPENLRVPYPTNMPQLLNGVYLETSNVNNTSFLVSLSKGCTYQQLPDDNGRKNVTRLYEICKVTPKDMIGDALFCVWAMNNYGYAQTTVMKRHKKDSEVQNLRSTSPPPYKKGCISPLQNIHRVDMPELTMIINSDDKLSEEPKTTIPFITGITAGSIILLALITGLTWYLYKIHKRSSKTGPAKHETWAKKPGM
ncbi:unnamed protein product [Mytilus coruscus]|uniref:Uncharacterized protein n=1 Tax=Mytilus coruscus TaxID=42192 RepID=A0A6J8B6H9_MYTCO|nr:unnamed protein product [Mytilus coruscus]